MFRTFFSSALISVAVFGMTSAAFAHPDPVETPKSSAKSVKMVKPELPSQADIQDALKQMPDMNAIMGGMMTVMKDEKFKDQMESSAKAFSKRMDAEDVFKKGPDGMPDFNKAFEVMLGTFSDEEAMGGMLETMMGLAEAMEEHIPQEAKKAVPIP